MLQTTTTLIETGMVIGSTGTTIKTASIPEKDKDGNITALLMDKKKAAIGTTIGTAITGGAYTLQEISYKSTLGSVRNAQSYVNSMSVEQLEKALMALGELELPNDTNSKTYTK